MLLQQHLPCQVHHWSFVCDRPLDEQPDLVDQTFSSMSREISEAYDAVSFSSVEFYKINCTDSFIFALFHLRISKIYENIKLGKGETQFKMALNFSIFRVKLDFNFS